MIELTQAYKVGDKTFATIASAQTAAIAALGFGPQVASEIVAKAADVLEILQQTGKNKPRKPRSDIGKKRAEASAAASKPAA